jgi:hypothetical protein
MGVFKKNCESKVFSANAEKSSKRGAYILFP